MAPLLVLIFLLVAAGLAPFLGSDTSDAARYDDHRDDRAWWPAGPDARPRPRY